MASKVVECNSLKGGERPSRNEAEKAIETLLRYIGEDHTRPGLLDTPGRVIRAYDEFFKGYDIDPAKDLAKTFDDIEGYDDMVIVKDIDFVSHCEHHMVTITGKAHVAYWPDENVVGISKLARVVDTFAKRLTSQEKMTKDIVNVIDDVLAPKGVAVMIDADHQCMSIRGVCKPGSSTVTSTFSGIFKEDANTRDRFLKMLEQ